MSDHRQEYFYVREWLNADRRHSTASIYAEVAREHGPGDSRKPSVWDIEAHLSLSDCTRSITLAFDFDDGDAMRNNIHKLDLLADSIEKFKAGLIAAWTDHKRELAEYEAREAESAKVEADG